MVDVKLYVDNYTTDILKIVSSILALLFQIKNGTFRKNEQLRTLDLSFNRIHGTFPMSSLHSARRLEWLSVEGSHTEI